MRRRSSFRSASPASSPAPRRRRATAAALALVPVALALSAVSSSHLTAQAPQTATDGPTFEVASIKPNTSGDGRVFMQNQPGRFAATNVTLRQLIRNAYQLQEFQISGGPSWISSDHFDIVAKIPASDADGQAPPAPGLP